MSRATTSVTPPGANGTITRTGRFGYADCARAGITLVTPSASAPVMRRRRSGPMSPTQSYPSPARLIDPDAKLLCEPRVLCGICAHHAAELLGAAAHRFGCRLQQAVAGRRIRHGLGHLGIQIGDDGGRRAGRDEGTIPGFEHHILETRFLQ